jgi:nickel transport protein
VYDSQGNELLKGSTDEKGAFSFKVPKRTDLKIVLKASMGHRAECRITAAQIEAAAHDLSQEAVSLTHTKGSRETSAGATVVLSREEIQTLIDQSLEKKLAPIMSALSQQVGRGPWVSQVIGGLGYILGLVGVALYVASRRRRGM